MGNKSNQQKREKRMRSLGIELPDAHPKAKHWSNARNVIASQLPRTSRSWAGMMRPNTNEPAMERLVSGRKGRLVPAHDGSRTQEFSKFKRPVQVRDVNTLSQPWQTHARKLAKRAESHLGWNARREAREARKAAASAEASIA